MKENRLGPRQWAFVVVAGGTVFALPFTQRQPDSKPQPAVVDVEATLLPEISAVAAPSTAVTAQSPTTTNSVAAVPAWPTLPHSPFDDLVQQKALVPEAKPTEEIVPMLPLRPWISAPNLSSGHSSNSSLASTQSTSSLRPLSTSTSTSTIANSKNAVAMASPWRDDDGDTGVDETSSQVVQSYGQGRRQLPVNAGPADQYTYEEIAQKLNLPKQELASAIVPADQVLPVPVPQTSAPGPGALAAQSTPMQSQLPTSSEPRSTSANVPKSSVVLGRQPTARNTGAQIRFGQANEQQATPANPSPAMAPLPTLPSERRGHIIMQPFPTSPRVDSGGAGSR